MVRTARILPDSRHSKAIPIHCLEPRDLANFMQKLNSSHRHAIEAAGFMAQAGAHVFLTDETGLASILFGMGERGSAERTPFLPGKLASVLPAGTYRFAKSPDNLRLATLAFALESYCFERYKKNAAKTFPILLAGAKAECMEVEQIAQAIFLARDLINTPANDLGPEELAGCVKQVAKAFGARVSITNGANLERGFPLIHAVGKGSARAPQLLDLQWGKETHPKVTLVGKGVVFDTGGLDIKSADGMLLMKKDMGGAACALALAQLIMSACLKVRLRLLIPAAENSISGLSFRPGDVLKSRHGQTVEVGNTDAEGRLILADALTYACEDEPDLLIDMATLTGAARIALGPDLPACFTPDNTLAREMEKAASEEFDPIWRMPLHQRYMNSLKSKIADLSNVSSLGLAGAITAALFLQCFVSTKAWMHLDLYAWTASPSPGRPEGGEAPAVRALFALLKKRYGKGRL